MVKTKQKGIAKWLCLAVFALCISLCLAMATTNTAYAATTPKYTLAYDYTHYYNYNTSKSADGSGTGVLSASVIVRELLAIAPPLVRFAVPEVEEP